MYVCVSVCACMYVHVCVHAYVYLIHTYVHNHTYMHIVYITCNYKDALYFSAAAVGSNKCTKEVPIIIGAVLGSLLIIFILITIICGISLIRRRKKNKLYDIATDGIGIHDVCHNM